MFKEIPIIVLTIFMISFALCGCQEQVNLDNPEPISFLPSIEFEATVVSLSLDDNIACEGICPAYQYPKDTG